MGRTAGAAGCCWKGLLPAPEHSSNHCLESAPARSSFGKSSTVFVAGGFTADDFSDLIDRVEKHLAMVFHRFVEGPFPALRILINDRAVRPWGPFHVRPPGKALDIPDGPDSTWRPLRDSLVPCPAAPRPPDGPGIRGDSRTGRLERATGLLCLSQPEAAGRRRVARPRAGPGVAQGGAVPSGADRGRTFRTARMPPGRSTSASPSPDRRSRSGPG